MNYLITALLLTISFSIRASPTETTVLKFDRRNTIHLIGPIDGKSLAVANKILKTARPEARIKRDLQILINSSGGSVLAGNMIIQSMLQAKSRGYKIQCVVGPLAASMAFVIFTFCDERYALSASLLLWHPARSNLQGGYTAEQLRTEATSLQKWETMYTQHMIQILGVSEEYYHKHNKAETLHVASQLVKETNGFLTILTDLQGVPDMYKF